MGQDSSSKLFPLRQQSPGAQIAKAESSPWEICWEKIPIAALILAMPERLEVKARLRRRQALFGALGGSHELHDELPWELYTRRI